MLSRTAIHASPVAVSRSTHSCPSIRRIQRMTHKRMNQRRANIRVRVATSVSTMRPAVPPMRLPRFSLGEADTAKIAAAFPELAGITPKYIRDRLRSNGPEMLNALGAFQTSIAPDHVPPEITYAVNDTIAAAPPSHIFSVYSPTTAPSQKRKVTLYPSHSLVFLANCARLPELPVNSPGTPSNTIPVVSMCIPNPEAFPLLHRYLYTKDIHPILAALHPHPNCTPARAQQHATLILGFWRDVCALSVIEDELWTVVNMAWAASMTLLKRSS